MKSILVIAERELKTYFISPIAYVVLTIFTFLSGFVFYFFVRAMVNSVASRAMMSAQTGRPPDPIDMPGLVVQSMFGFLSFVLLLLLPMITMALFSEEKKRGTMELLLTAPVTDLQVVLGKFLAASTFYLILLSTTLVEIAILFVYSQPAKGPILSALLGIVLYGLAIIAIGMFISTLTESQIVSVILSFGVLMVLWLIGAIAQNSGPTAKAVLSYLSILDHTNDFLQGVISTSHIIFYLSLIVLGVFLTYRSLDSLRWRS